MCAQRKFSHKKGQNRLRYCPLNEIFRKVKSPPLICVAFATAIGVATTLSLAAVLALVSTATALPFATVLARAIMLASRVAARRIRARRVGAVLCVSFHGYACHQSGDGRSNEECSLGSGHTFVLVWVCSGIYSQNHLLAKTNQSSN
jgi:hypothetical protein